jgi:zinc protease
MAKAVDINETVTNAEGSYAIFKDAVAKKMFNPSAVLASSKRVFQGTATRALVNLHTPDPKIAAKMAAALTADVGAVGGRKVVGDVSFDRLPKFGPAGTIASRETILDGPYSPKVEKLVFANGVTLLIHQNASEVSKVYVNVRFGRGLAAMPNNRRTPAWAGSGALVASGVGDLGQEELDALTGQRRMGFDFGVGDDAFTFFGQTTAADLPDQLKLFATKLAHPGWDPNPVLRTRTAVLSSYAGMTSSPDAVMGRDLDGLLHSGDPRWGVPPQSVVASLTPAAFRQFWEPLLASGPIEVEVFGDMDTETTIKAFAATFGALPPRPAGAAPTPPPAFPKHVVKPVVRTHTGQPDQAAAVIAWPTGGGSAGITESRKLEILVAVFRDRLLDKLRSEAGVSYSPNVGSDWPIGASRGGKIMALGMIPPDKTAFFFTLARGIAADLVAKPIDADELNRALTPFKSMIIRASTGNPFWMRLVEGGGSDPLRVTGVTTLARDISYTSPEEIQALAVKYLKPDTDWTMVVLPAKSVTKKAAAK